LENLQIFLVIPDSGTVPNTGVICHDSPWHIPFSRLVRPRLPTPAYVPMTRLLSSTRQSRILSVVASFSVLSMSEGSG
jgi:hypothetical protein